LSYAQHFKLCDDKLKIIPSLQVSYFNKTIDNSKLTFGDQIDARRGFTWYDNTIPPKSSKSNVDISAGLIVNYKHLYIGSSLFHITQPDEGLQGPSKLPYRISSFASYNLFLGDNVLINALFRFEKQQSFTATNFNINALIAKHLMVSAGLRNDNAINTLIGYRHNYFTISGGYEFGISGVSSHAGSFEICASFNLRNNDDRKIVKDFERW
jgi:type IX secretion system PorP/SprF family membrane protein